MIIKINAEQPFQVLSTTFSIGPSSSGYDLMASADGVNYSKLFTVGANVNRQVTQVAAGSYYYLAGNTGNVVVNWFGNCVVDNGGGGSYVLPVASQDTLGGVKIGSGLTMSGDTLNANPGGYTLPIASENVLGGVKIGSGITIDSGGTISAQGGGTQYTAGNGIDLSGSTISVKIGDGLAFSGNTLVVSGETGGDYVIYDKTYIDGLSQADRASLLQEIVETASGGTTYFIRNYSGTDSRNSYKLYVYQGSDNLYAHFLHNGAGHFPQQKKL